MYIIDHEKPRTPEQLMRSRYTAYVLLDIDYIEKTMKGPAAQNFNKEEALKWASQVTWLGLEIRYTHSKKNQGRVEFIAEYQHQGIKDQLHEISEFRLEDDQWYYFDGRII